jgi:hypothetical protein
MLLLYELAGGVWWGRQFIRQQKTWFSFEYSCVLGLSMEPAASSDAQYCTEAEFLDVIGEKVLRFFLGRGRGEIQITKSYDGEKVWSSIIH